ncbi:MULTISPECIES: DUF2268 domain-containing putative Zn-dependent protease [unclassified Rhodococcus (in: high G+C Gram-positive bacteria)]|uniref:DUF2268 domain-containing putative Zn-dependent protease n=1 Tax=Rhodococcus sp. SJ-3 TaxID=3454628 RepID=UPI003F79AFD1
MSKRSPLQQAGVLWVPHMVTVGEHMIAEGLAEIFASELYGNAGYTHLVHDETCSAIKPTSAESARSLRCVEPVATCEVGGRAAGETERSAAMV